MSNLRRSMMMAGRGGGDPYAGLITLEFDTSSDVTKNLTDTSDDSHLNVTKIIVDGNEVTVNGTTPYTFTSGHHKIGYLLADMKNIASPCGIGEVWPNGQGTNKVVTYPASIETIGSMSFRGKPCVTPARTIVYAITPPTCSASTSIGLWYSVSSRPIYVPDESVEAYKVASVWSQYASAYKPLSQLP